MPTPEELGLPSTLYGFPVVVEDADAGADQQNQQSAEHQQQILATLQAAHAAIASATQSQGGGTPPTSYHPPWPPGWLPTGTATTTGTVTEDYTEAMPAQTSGYLQVGGTLPSPEVEYGEDNLDGPTLRDKLDEAISGDFRMLLNEIEFGGQWKLVSHQVQHNVDNDMTSPHYGEKRGIVVLHLTLVRK